MSRQQQVTVMATLLALLMALASEKLLVPVACELPETTGNEIQEQLSVESRQQKDSDDLTATINYLDRMDKLFSQMARPRFGRSEYKQPHFGRLPTGSGSRLGLQKPMRIMNTVPRYKSLSDLLNGRFVGHYNEAMTELY